MPNLAERLVWWLPTGRRRDGRRAPTARLALRILSWRARRRSRRGLDPLDHFAREPEIRYSRGFTGSYAFTLRGSRDGRYHAIASGRYLTVAVSPRGQGLVPLAAAMEYRFGTDVALGAAGPARATAGDIVPGPRR